MSNLQLTKRCLWACVLSTGLIANTWAQDEADAPTEEANVADVQTITVTGSRIPRSPDFVQSNPVVSVDAEDIRQAGSSSLGDFFKELPALTGSTGSYAAAGTNPGIGLAGLNLLNLRNLGRDRTLVLVDGKRHVSSVGGSSAVDIDTIPRSLIERVDIQTGGISAVYGADAVSGVVNFVMRRDFEGIEARTEFGQSSERDARTRLASIVGGRNFADGRLNLTGAYEYASSDALRSADRSFSGGDARRFFVNNPADFQPDDDPTVPDFVPLADVRYFDSSPDGYVIALDEAFEFAGEFNGRGQPWDGGSPVPNSFLQLGGDGTPLTAFNGDLTPDNERHTLSTFLTFDASEKLRLTADLKYSRSESFTAGQPTFEIFPAALIVENDNPFIPESIATASGPDGLILVARDHFDLGVRQDDIERETLRGVVGFEFQLADQMRLETSLVYGRTAVDAIANNNRYNDRFAAALDSVVDPVTGQPTCRSNLDPAAEPVTIQDQIGQGAWNDYEPLPGTWAGSFEPGPNSGCLPFSPFAQGVTSPEATRWIVTDSLSTYRIEQTVFTAALTGTTFNWFAPTNSDLGYALGFERRIEQSRSVPAIEDQLGLTLGNLQAPERGRYEVTEMFAELSVPLLENIALTELLNAEMAIRLSDYDTIGRTRTWRGGLSWTPISDLTLRATRAKATRAPNIGELFGPAGQTFANLDGPNDPCSVPNLDSGTEFRRANCLQLLTALGVDNPGNFVNELSGSVPGTLRGNSELREEDAHSTTLGIVLTPRFAPGLSVSLDWYDIELDNAVFAAFPDEASRLCVDTPTLENQFCPLVTREAGTGRFVDFQQQPVNVARLVTRGYDLNLRYQMNPRDLGIEHDIGTFDIRLIGNKLQTLTFVNLPGAPPDSDKGEGPERGGGEAPEWQAKFDLRWNLQRLTLGYGLNYFDETLRFRPETIAGNPDVAESRFFRYKAKFVQDLFAQYALPGGISLFGGVDNVADVRPDVDEDFYPVSAVGRFFFVGLEYRP